MILLLLGVARGETRELTFMPPGPGDSLYQYATFEVPPGTGRVHVAYAYDRNGNTVDIGLFDCQGFRGWSGGKRSEFSVAADRATPGYLPGPLPPGQWKVILGLYQVQSEGVTIRLTIDVEPGSATRTTAFPRAFGARGGPGWYRGDLHMHTEHSDGDQTLDELVAYALGHHLQFLGLTEHNTVSHHGAFSDEVLLIPGEEITTRHGHCNAWGEPAGHWLDFRQPVAALVKEVHELGGLISANHPYALCKGCVWEYGFDLPLDSVEVWNGAWDPTDEQALELWVGLLKQGRHLPLVGSSDSHKLSEPIGNPTLHVWAEALSQQAVLDAVKAGRSFVTATPATPPLALRAGEKQIGDTVVIPNPDRVRVRAEGPGLLTLVTPTTRRPVESGAEVELAFQSSGFVYLEARDENGQMLGLTNPIYVKIATMAAL